MPKFLSDGFFDGSSTDLIVDGKVGIGTSSSLTYPFYAKSGGAFATVGKFESGVANAYIQISSTGQSDADSGYIGHNSSRVMSFLGETFTIVNSTTGEKIRIDSSGNMGINTTNPEQKLHVAGNFRLENQLYDSTNSQGSVGQILSKVSAGTQWIDQGDVTAGSASRTEILVKNLEGSALSKGDPVYIIGSVGASERLEIGLADAGDAAKMPCVGLLTQDLAINGEGTAIVTGKLKNLITSPIDGATPTENDTIYVKSGGGLTLTKPTGSTNLIQNVGQVGRVSTSSDGNIVVSAILRSNDVPNLPTGKIWVGDGNTTVSDVVYLDEANGRMGIGTTSPGQKLAVSGGNIEIADANIAGGRKIGFNVSDSISFNSTTIAQYGMSNAGNSEAGGITYSGFFGQKFFTDGTQRMVIKRFGNVGIGTTSPSYKLDVSGDGAFGGTTISANTGLTVRARSGDLGDIRIRFDAAGTLQRSYISDYYTGEASNIGFERNNSTGTGIITFDTSNSSFSPSERMRINSSGNVGIGTTSPVQKLDVSGNARVSGILYTNAGVTSSVGISGKAIANGWASRYDSNSANYSGFYFDGNNQSIILGRNSGGTIVNYIHANASSYFNGGNVGIGYTDPQEKLHIYNGSAYITPIAYAANQNDWVIRAGAYNSTSFDQGLKLKSSSGGVSYMAFETTGNTETMVLRSGKIGIGTADPVYSLDVNDDKQRFGENSTLFLAKASSAFPSYSDINTESAFISHNGGSSRAVTMGVSDDSNIAAYVHVNELNNPGTSFVSIGTNTQERLRIKADGNVGIGDTNPDAKLTVFRTDSTYAINLSNTESRAGLSVKSTSTYDAKLTVSTGTSGVQQIQGVNNAATTGRNIAINPYGGNVGIGQSNPSAYKLDVSGTIRATGDVIAYSDIRVKENIKTIDNAIDKVKALRGVEYNKIDSTEKSIGVIAQEIEEVIPEVVREDDQGMKSVAYGNITAVLIEAIKEQQKQIDELKKQLDAFTK